MTSALTPRQEFAVKCTRFDIRTLLALWDADADDTLIASSLGVSRQRVVDWRRGKGNMVPWWRADEYAIRIGTHPAMVWLTWCDDALAEPYQEELWTTSD